jgi:hypothetical protein
MVMMMMMMMMMRRRRRKGRHGGGDGSVLMAIERMMIAPWRAAKLQNEVPNSLPPPSSWKKWHTHATVRPTRAAASKMLTRRMKQLHSSSLLFYK